MGSSQKQRVRKQPPQQQRHKPTPISVYTSAPFKALTPSQFKAFKEFKNLLEKNDTYWPVSSIEAGVTERNDDLTLLRYLRARNFDPSAAFKQYKNTAKWRKDLDLTESYDNVEVETFEAIRRLFPQWTGRRAKSGHPVFGYVVSEIRTEDLITTSQADPGQLSVFMPAEHSTEFVYPLCSHLNSITPISSSSSSSPSATAKQPITAAVNIIDLSGVGVRHFWALRNHLQKASTMATAHYPETVEKIFVIGAPSFFPTVWGFITRWFDASTTGKIIIVPSGSKEKIRNTLEKYIEVADIPTRWGGELEWEFGGQPSFDEMTVQVLGGRREVRGPVRVVERLASGESDEAKAEEAGKNERFLVAVGQEGSVPRREVLGRVRDETWISSPSSGSRAGDRHGTKGGDEDDMVEVVIEKRDSADTVEL